MAQERLTEELLERLKRSRTMEEFLAEPEVGDWALADYLRELLSERNMKTSDVARAAGLTGTQYYAWFSGKALPKRDNAIMLAFGLGCDLRQTQRILRLSGVSELYVRRRRDAIMIWCIEHGKTRGDCDEELYKLGEKTLLQAE